MDKRFLGVIAGVAVVVALSLVLSGIISISIVPVSYTDEKIGLVVNSPNQSTTLQELDQVYAQAAGTGAGRSNVYLFWNLIEPVRGEYDWQQSDVLMGFNEKNNLKVTLYFSIINGKTLGPFPDWIGKPPLNSIGENRIVSVLDEILSRYNIVDTVILAGQTESQFRFYEQNIPVYKELFEGVYDKIKDRHPDVKIGNAFALDQVINKNLQHVVTELAVGDFIAFSYSPVDVLYDIVKTPQEAKEDLQQAIVLAGEKRVGIFEISWSTSDFIKGDDSGQTEFLAKSFEFYSENEPEIEFFTWYRQYDRPEGTCQVDGQKIGDDTIQIGNSSLGTSEHVIKRVSNYICSAGLINNDGTPKSGWNEFKAQIQMIN